MRAGRGKVRGTSNFSERRDVAAARCRICRASEGGARRLQLIWKRSNLSSNSGVYYIPGKWGGVSFGARAIQRAAGRAVGAGAAR